MSVETYLEDHFDEALNDLKAYVSIPSVSTDPAFGHGIDKASLFLAERLKKAGFDNVERLPTGGHPAVYGEIIRDPSLKTILVYGHYDVQPPDPFEKWVTPPFEPSVRDDRLYARGASDDKGPLLIPILVAEAYLKTEGQVPVNLKILVEGEEENGSPHFESTLETYREKFACDLVVSADGAMWRADRPSLTVASRGNVALEVTVTGASKDLHSGRHGGSAPNPIAALAGLMSSMHGPDGQIIVDGFHDGRIASDPKILAAIDAAHFDAAGYYREIGIQGDLPVADGNELLRRQWLEPTIEFNGIYGGYQGHGTKTVIPSTATVKMTCRLVAGQKPKAVIDAIVTHLTARLPAGLSIDFESDGSGSEAFSIDPDLPALSVAEDVLAGVLGERPLRVAMGATVPIGSAIAKVLGKPAIFFSFATSDEDYHAPNEFFRLSSFRTGLKAWARLLAAL